MADYLGPATDMSIEEKKSLLRFRVEHTPAKANRRCTNATALYVYHCTLPLDCSSAYNLEIEINIYIVISECKSVVLVYINIYN